MSNKRFAAVICEYNPFHYGHEFQLNELKKEYGGVVCIMSGDLVQRGGAAVAGKYLRARTAIAGGADLVLELPAPWCCASAADFARAGVCIAKGIGVSALAFGAEGESETLFSVAELYGDPSFTARVSELASGGGNVSYPSAFCTAVKERLGDTAAEEMKKPNNILAVEYLRRLSKSGVEPKIIRRNQNFESSSAIRALGGENMLSALPEASRSLLSEHLGGDFPRDISRLDAFFIGFFRTIDDIGELGDIYGMTPDLAAKLLKNAKRANGFEELCNSCVDKKHTAARVRRAVIAAALGFTAQSVRDNPAYTLVLAANDTGRELLAQNRKNGGGITVITKPAHALMSAEKIKGQFALSKRASDIMALTAPTPQRVDIGTTPWVSPQSRKTAFQNE